MLRSNKLVDLDAKKVAAFTQNLACNAASLLLAFKTKMKLSKNCKNETMSEKHKYRYFVV